MAIEISTLPPVNYGPDELRLSEVIDGLLLARRRGDPDEVSHWESLIARKEQGEAVTRAIARYEPPHPIYHEIAELLNYPYDLLKHLEKFGLKVKNFDTIGPEAVREACLEYIKSDKFRERYSRMQDARREDEERNNLKKRWINITGKRLRELTELSLNAIVANNEPPIIFIRAGFLVKVGFDEKGNPIIRFLKENGVRHVMERCADYTRDKLKANGTLEEIPIPPPIDVVRDFMELSEFPFPALIGIIECPTILDDNTLIVERGYHSGIKFYYAPNGKISINVPDHPSQSQVEEATELIKEIFCDFPFDCEASRTNMIAGLLTVVLRPMIQGNCQLLLINKPCPGTGASLLTDVISLIATGHKAAMMTAKESDEEWRKAITSMLLSGQTVINVDNIEGKLYSPSLATILTSDIWLDRALGRNENITLPNRSVWIANGNNVQLAGDMPRRCYEVRVDAQEARPWHRRGFRHPDLPGWVLQERGRILSAVLTITRGWIQAGRRPPVHQLDVLGGFENWQNTIGGILEFCGLNEFLGNLETTYEDSDCDTPQWESFISKWYEIWRDNSVTVAQIHQYLKMDDGSYSDGKTRLIDVLPDALADAWSGKKSFVRVLGKALAKRNGRIMPNGLLIKKKSSENRAIVWQVTSKNSEGGLQQQNELLELIPAAVGIENNIKTKVGISQTNSNNSFEQQKLPLSKSCKSAQMGGEMVNGK